MRATQVGLAAVIGAWAVVPSAGCGGGSSSSATGDDAGPSDASTGPTTDASGPKCGNGVVDPGEQCDNGAANGPGAGCESNCMWTCVAGDGGTLANCKNDPCLTPPSCTAKHTCVNGTPIPVGGSCGMNMVCNMTGSCITAKCGDGIVEPGEECDNGAANGPGTGCEDDCHFTCGGDEPTIHNCNSTDSCTANGMCVMSTHTCNPGAPVSNGTTCMTSTATAGVCESGKCAPATCGDGIVESGEQCDFGAGNGAGTGCETDCKFSCPTIGQTTGCTQPIDPCAGADTCGSVTVNGDMGQKCTQGAALGNGTSCTTGGTTSGTCTNGACTTAACGDGKLETGEQCDFGSAENGKGLGCGADCQFDCEKTPTDTCTTGVDPCTATPTACATVTTSYGTMTGQTCQATTPIAACGACGAAGDYCAKTPGNKCAPASCGDGCVEPGEQCDPPGPTCSSTCQNIVCGDGVREGTEQCDDHNNQNLDGCSSTCLFEQIHRVDSITMVFSTSNVPCGANALGGAIGSFAQGDVTTPITNGVTAGTTNILLDFLGITDLTGENQASLSLGALAGLAPTYGTGITGSNGKDVDWWYVMDPTSVTTDSMGHYQPGSSLLAKLVSGVLSASGSIDLTLGLTGAAPSTLHMSTSQLSASTGAVTTPTESGTAMMSPGHLATENLDPSITSFQTMTGGSLCGNVSAGSLAGINLTTSITGTCTSYTTSDTFLDLIAGGCLAPFGVTATSPDKSDPAQPVWGAGPPYTFVETSHHVTACKDKAGTATTTAAQLATCLASAAYSSWFDFTSDRVIVHNK